MQTKEKKILNTLKRYSEHYDQKQGISLEELAKLLSQPTQL